MKKCFRLEVSCGEQFYYAAKTAEQALKAYADDYPGEAALAYEMSEAEMLVGKVSVKDTDQELDGTVTTLKALFDAAGTGTTLLCSTAF